MNNLPPKPKTGFWRSLTRVLQLLVIAYLLIVLAALIFQRRLIYFPTKIPADLAVRRQPNTDSFRGKIRPARSSAGNFPPPITCRERFDNPRQRRLRD